MLASLLFFAVLLSACARESGPDVRHFSGNTMGTTYNITVVSEPGERLTFDDETLQAKIDEQLRLINRHMSTYIDDSELMLFNAAEANVWHAVSEPMAEVLRISQQVSVASGGAFDVTVGPLVNLWGFGPLFTDDQVPEPEAIADMLGRVGYTKLELEGTWARKSDELFVDLSGVAKGYGADWLADFLAQQGLRNYLVEIGGDLRAVGVNPRGQPWRIAIEKPSLARSGVVAVASLDNRGMVTSGDYRNYFEADGRRYSHTIDPSTGYPVDHNLVSVTVVADTAALADAWATALMVLGPEAGMIVAEREQLAVFMILSEEGELIERQSPSFSRYM